MLDDLPVARSKNSAPAGYLKSKDASSIRAVVLIGVAAAFCATFTPHMPKPGMVSKLEEAHLVACSPQWLPVLLASSSQPTGPKLGCLEKSLASVRRANEYATRLTVPRSYNHSKFFDLCSCEKSEADFSSQNMRESGKSSTSATIVRQRAFVVSIVHVLSRPGDQHISATMKREQGSSMCLKDLQPPENFTLYNTEAHGRIHDLLSSKFGAAYTASEFVSPSAEPGSMHKSQVGIVRHEDLRALSFPSNSFDLVMSAEVFEHIPEPYVALAEVFRVLKPGGSYVWTVPMNADPQSKDTQISMLNAAGKRFDAADPAIKSPQFHGDPMAPEGGIVVFQIFGAGAALQDVRDRFRVYPHLQFVQQEVRHRRPWRGHDDDSAQTFVIAAWRPRLGAAHRNVAWSRVYHASQLTSARRTRNVLGLSYGFTPCSSLLIFDSAIAARRDRCFSLNR